MRQHCQGVHKNISCWNEEIKHLNQIQWTTATNFELCHPAHDDDQQRQAAALQLQQHSSEVTQSSSRNTRQVYEYTNTCLEYSYVVK